MQVPKINVSEQNCEFRTCPVTIRECFSQLWSCDVQHIKMATKQIVGVFFLIFVNFAKGSVFDGILDDVSSCKEVCKNTYTPHTYEKVNSRFC